MLSRLLRQIVFKFIHLVACLLVAVQNVYHRFWLKLQETSNRKSEDNDIKMILKHVPKLSKRLKHLVVLVDIDRHIMSDLANLVIWSLVAGIPYFSFYDITGQLKKNEEKLFYEIEQSKKGVPGCIKWINKPDLNGYTNGIQAHTLVVNIFDSNDGRPKLAECLRRIATGEITCDRNSSEFTAQELNKAICLLYPPIPDPDLILYMSPFCCLHGFLPWQIRLTEFIQLSLDFSIDVNSYLGALYKYNKIDQRFGK